ncbi:ATP-binding protein [Streptomyces nogalater]
MARRFVRSVLDGLVPDVRDTAELLTGELVTNAVVHARTEIEVTAWTAGGRAHVRVGDRRPDYGLVPHVRHLYACTGRGWPWSRSWPPATASTAGRTARRSGSRCGPRHRRRRRPRGRPWRRPAAPSP